MKTDPLTEYLQAQSDRLAPEWAKLTERCREAMAAAKEKPGRYGGRYVARIDISNELLFVVLKDDDPDTVPKNVDVLAQCTPTKVFPIGRARHYLKEDGQVQFPHN